ncbi:MULTISPECIES: LysR family transcriptional regulator [Oceanimonas]|uniref:LysR family transcriptional regulator n=1 Tax=Oceanimonas doudoroffii TaxID=84158 RepID=A0A233RH39_9GAMM|nr:MULTISPECIES: LysR family transcriptional regulator [Oceanimonas]NHI00711.1 Hydrogen peroxide-inducible genes activator [Oceanimonas sp. MB9]OXY82704.1 LysR family transcriptional regulator [Oceanimonas doudoroffii]
MKYRQLQAFLATIQQGSFSRAALILSLSQPSISRLINDLQDDVGFELFKKQKGRMVPTPEGVAFYDEVSTIFNGIHHLENFADKLKKSTHGSLTIGATPALATILTPMLIKSFIDKHPQVHVSLLVDSVEQLIRGLDKQQYDLIMTNQTEAHSGFIEEPLAEVSWVCVMPATHALAEKAIITPADLQGECLLKLVDENGIEWSHHKSLLKEHHIKVNEQFSTQRSLSGYGMVAAGLCIALLEPFNASLWEGSNLVMRPFAPELKYRYSMYYSAGQVRSELSRAFTLCARDSIGQLPGYC